MTDKDFARHLIDLHKLHGTMAGAAYGDAMRVAIGKLAHARRVNGRCVPDRSICKTCGLRICGIGTDDDQCWNTNHNACNDPLRPSDAPDCDGCDADDCPNA